MQSIGLFRTFFFTVTANAIHKKIAKFKNEIEQKWVLKVIFQIATRELPQKIADFYATRDVLNNPSLSSSRSNRQL